MLQQGFVGDTAKFFVGEPEKRESDPLKSNQLHKPTNGRCQMYIYIKKVPTPKKTYYYLVVEEYMGNGKRRRIAHISVQDILKKFNSEAVGWCGGWGLNPRRPTPTGLKPAPFGRARAPPLSVVCFLHWRSYFCLEPSLLPVVWRARGDLNPWPPASPEEPGKSLAIRRASFRRPALYPG